MCKAIDKAMTIGDVRLRREDEGAGVKVAVLTVSDRVSRGEAEDGSGDLLEQLLREDGFDVRAAARAGRARRDLRGAA